MACHGHDGKGLSIGTQLMAPSFVKSAAVNGDPKLLARILLKGIQKTDQNYLGIMAGMEAQLQSDEVLAGIMTYIRNDFENSSSVVTAADAAKYREELKGATAITRAEIDAELAKQ